VIDCLIIGYNDVDFGTYVSMLQQMGVDKGAYRDLNLAFVTHGKKPYRSMDLLNLFNSDLVERTRRFTNVDFLWPVITYLSTYLTRRGFTVRHANLFQDEKQDIIDLLQTGEVRSVAITTTLYVWMTPIVEVVELIREHSPTTTIIVGGPYVHNQARALDAETLKESLALMDADVYVVSPEGEATLARVLDALRSKASLAGIPNLIYRDGDQMVRTAEVTEQNSLADEMVDYSLFSADDFRGFVSLRTAKSCPFACAFCAFPERSGAYTYLPVPLVEQELDAIRRLESVTTLSFIDDTFNVPKGRFKELLRMMIRKQYGFRWNSYLRSDHVDDEAIELMARSGCEGVFLGVESGSDRILTAMNKTSRRAHYQSVIPKLRDVGIISHANVILGFPGETVDSIAETADLIETARPDFFRAQLWYCDPTTPVWRQRDVLKIKGSAFSWSHPTMDSDTACAWMERLFNEISGSIWLPQYGFETWSLYYLQRRGMPLDQVKRFVRAFNAGVRAKVLDPSGREVTADLLTPIREAGRFPGQIH
jgi:anaerobic magnesium-protoporphyrin IX monomethyl ester cyclase